MFGSLLAACFFGVWSVLMNHLDVKLVTNCSETVDFSETLAYRGDVEAAAAHHQQSSNTRDHDQIDFCVRKIAVDR